MILNRLLITAALMLFSMTLTAQKTYLPLTVGTDTIGFFEGNAFDPYKKKYLFKSTQADKFVESHPDLDFEWSTNEQTYELKLKWNSSSQDYVEYNDFTFTQNGEELSLEQINDLTLLHQAGRGNFRRGNRFDFMHKNPYIRSRNNTLNLLGGAATGIYGVTGVYSGVLGMFVGAYDSEPYYLRLGALFLGAGTGLCVVSYKAFSRVVQYQEMCLPRRDRQFKKVADKINQAIQSSNQ